MAQGRPALVVAGTQQYVMEGFMQQVEKER